MTLFAALMVSPDTLRYVPSFRSNRLGAGLRPSPTLFVGYRHEINRSRQALRYGCRVTLFAALMVSPDTLRYVPSFRSNRLGAGLRPSPTLFVGYRHEFGIPTYT